MLLTRSLLIAGAGALAVGVAACGSGAYGGSRTTAGSGAASGSAPLTVATAGGSMGRYLTGSSGRALYLWVADGQGRSRCTGSCATAWPPLTAATLPRAGGGVDSAALTLVARPDGSRQVAYRGHPLYYFSGDTGSSTTNGEGLDGFGARWWLVAPSGTAITSAAPGGGGAPSAPSSPY